MKSIKLYNVIFPIWLILFFPPFIFIALIGNFIIDSIVIIICFNVFRLIDSKGLLYYYRKTIFKVWIFGFLADFVGAMILFLIQLYGDKIGISYNIISSIAFNPFSNILGFIFILIAMSISALLIYKLNRRFTFKGLIEDGAIRAKFAIIIAIVTAPWTFLIPTKIFY